MRQHPEAQAAVIDYSGIRLSKKFVEMGICVCQSCTRLNPTDRTHCKYCEDELFIDNEDYLENDIN